MASFRSTAAERLKSSGCGGPAFTHAGPPGPLAETFATADCSVTIRRIDGPDARELFLLCQPLAENEDAGIQAETVYRAIARILSAEGGGGGSVISETVFLRHLKTDYATVREARERVFGQIRGTTHRPATTEIEQPPADGAAALQVSVHAVLPRLSPYRFDVVHTTAACECAECARPQGLRIDTGRVTRFYAGGLLGKGGDAYEQTLAMFGLAEDLLKQAGMEFSDVVRTWIHLRDIDRDYEALNRARRVFFEARGINPVPASTGIGGPTVSEAHELSLGLYAVQHGRDAERSVMTSPTLNEAMEYGADFVRGMKVVEANKISLHVSGTASIDEAGRSAHFDDLPAQAARMLLNIAALLERHGATFADVVSAITYVKRPADAVHLRQILQNAGFVGFPNALVIAPICRPELLCEIEALAVLPLRNP